MRVVIAVMKHETNTFSPVPTEIDRFARGGSTTMPVEGQEAYDLFKGTGSGLAAYIDLAEQHGAEIEIPMCANAWPSGPVADDAYRYMTDKIAAAVEKGCDAILLDLHGAMVTQSLEDGEGNLVRRLREIAPDTPMAVALDMHTNMYDDIADNAITAAELERDRSLHAKRFLGAGGSLSEALGVDLRAGEIARAMRAEELHADVRTVLGRIGALSGVALPQPEVVIRRS